MRKLKKKSGYLSLLAAIALISALSLTSCADRGAGEKVDGLADDADSTVYDLYVMSLCPFGFTAVAELSDLHRAFPKRTLNVWFIGRVDGDNLSSMRGEPEMYDETLWLGVKELYPKRYMDFLYKRGHSKASTEDLIKEMKLDFEKIRSWADKEGRAELREHYIHSVNRNINASPTLFVNNDRYSGRISGGQMVRAKCSTASVTPQFCKEYQECSDDNDCYIKGKLGKCVNPGKSGKERAACEYWDDITFTFTVLVADSTIDSPERQVIDWCERTLPGAKTRIVKFSSEEGERLIKQHNPPALPFFHIEKAAEWAHRFSTVRERLEPAADGGYQLKRGGFRENYFPQRVEKPGLIELYADPLAPAIGLTINTLLSDPNFAERIVLRPLLTGGQRDQSQPVLLNRLRTEEALRWITLANDFPKSYHPYLKSYAENPGSSYWFNWLNNVSVSKERLLRKIEANEAAMTSYRTDIAAISSGEPVMIMLNNRTKVTVSNEWELKRLIPIVAGLSSATP